jgi:malonate-semialdehyde dehydrogenase (acetylating)/methylmalonate-semialdehyde dehydrogenase
MLIFVQEYTINQLVGAAFGAAGQRCMALTTAVVVGEARHWMPEVVILLFCSGVHD